MKLKIHSLAALLGLTTVLICTPYSAYAEDKEPSFFESLFGSAKEMVETGVDTAKDAGDSAADAAKDAAASATDAAASAGMPGAEEAKKVVDTAADTAKDAGDAAKAATDVAKEVTEDAADTAKRMGNQAVDVAKEAKDLAEKTTDDFQWSKENLDLVAAADTKRGEELAQKHKCYKCHGDTGISDEDDTPSIAGQIAAYTYKQLHDYKLKIRDDRDMYKKVKKLSNQDMVDLSAWFEQQEPEKMAGNPKKAPMLATKGDESRLLLACDVCHNEKNMKRGFQIPIIAGQKPEHFVETMMAFKEEERVNDHYNLMRAISSRLTEEEITELAAYYSTKPMEDE